MTQLRSEKGTYALVLRLPQETVFPSVGRTGRFRGVILQAGYHIYVGSAHGSGGVKSRVMHHLGNHESEPVWHLDSLRPAMEIEEAWVTYDLVKRECAWANLVHRNLGGHVPVPGLGSADCNICPAHFFYFAKQPTIAAFRKAIQASLPGHASVEQVSLMSVAV